MVFSSMVVSPVAMRPSAGTRSPGRTRTLSPGFSSVTGTVSPETSRAVSGVSVMSLSTASRAPAAVCCSIRLAISMKKAMMPATL